MTDRLLDICRKIVAKFIKKVPPGKLPYTSAKYQGQIASDLIKEKLNAEAPCMIARFGSVELNIVAEYCNSQIGLKKYLQYIIGEIDSYKISDASFISAINNAGIFPSNIDVLSRFSELMLIDMREVDILGSWQVRENDFEERLSKAIKVRLPDLEPYYHSNPWSSCLEGKNVLVIHPFAQTIKEQYKKRSKLFENPLVLPEFNLTTIRSVQSNAGEKVRFTDWFDALNHMKGLIDKATFDVAIIGCGAYGFPLAAHVKRIGKKSVHLGGATQIFFGIKGARWNEHLIISKLFNEHWVTPNKNETPRGFKNVEGGCYW